MARALLAPVMAHEEVEEAGAEERGLPSSAGFAFVIPKLAWLAVIWVVVRNYDPFLGTLHIRCRIIIGYPKRDHKFDNHPYEL